MRSNVGARIAEEQLVAVIRADDWQLAVSAAEAVVEGGIRVIEITCTVPQGELAIAELRRRFGIGVLVGAGTVITPDNTRRMADAGAQFLVSPGSTPTLLNVLAEEALPFIVGAVTPSEVMIAVDHGAEFVKIFPAEALGTAWLRALRAPFPCVEFIPTGGITPANTAEWLTVGAVALGTGSALVPASILEARDFQTITKNANEQTSARDAWRSAIQTRLKHAGA